MAEKKGLKIIKLTTENVKKLKAVEIVPEDNTVVISGANENGKTSVLDAIFMALGGKVASKGVTKPIRDGQESAFSRVDLGDIIVTRKWTKSGTSLTVENREGAVFKSPQAILDNLIGNLSFDPLAFSNMKNDDQMETLLDLVNIDLDLGKWGADRATAYEDRTEVNRNVKQLEGQLVGIVVPEDTPDEETSATTILAEIEEAQEVKDSNDEERREVDGIRRMVGDVELEIHEVEIKVTELSDKLASAEELLAHKKKVKGDMQTDLIKKNPKIAALVDPDMSIFQERLQSVEETNKAVRKKGERVEVEVRLKDAKADSEKLTEKIDGLDTKKSDAIEAAEFPIEHLGFDDTGVTYKGIPFGQCSAAERLRVSLSMAISMNPRLRVLRITDGSLLDSKNMAIIQDMVKEHDFQCWIEVVDESGKMGIYIEDGEIKEVEA